MKKMILPALCLSLILSSFNAAALHFKSAISVHSPTDERKIIKTSELPQAVRSVLESEAYKNWKVKEVVEVKIAGAQNRPDLKTQYDVKLAKGKETKTVRFLEDGRVDN
jgi:hypothetical protein